MEARSSDGNITESDDEFEDKISPPKVKVDRQKRKRKQKEDLKKHSEEDNVITPVNKGTEVKKRDLSLTIVNEEECAKGGITASLQCLKMSLRLTRRSSALMVTMAPSL